MIAFRHREEHDGDAAFLFDLFAAAQGGALAHLDDALRRTLLLHQFAGQGTTYRDAHPCGRFEIIEVAGARAGRLVTDRSFDRIWVVDIALMPDRRRLGIGTHLLRTLQGEARAAGQPLMLSVLRCNAAARRLYGRLGFEPCGATDIHNTMRWIP